MNTITVKASHTYPVLIQKGLIGQLGEQVSAVAMPCKVAIISDSNVWPLHGLAATQSLLDSGFHVLHYCIDAGEASKNGETYLNILNFLAANQLTRSDVIIALGGGVVGDITGFAAATYLRGIRYIQVPTTLLAMVDSSVGGKTAIDLPSGKNLAGAFYQPSLVLCDTAVLDTLPEEIFRDGCAEVIKYGVLFDKVLFDHLLQCGMDFDRESVIARCIELKADVVCADEFDHGQRQLLNLGHTLGHAVEAQSKLTIPHGQAVAIGMALITQAASKYGICGKETALSVTAVLDRFSLPTHSPYGPDALFNSALSDKKRTGDTVNLIIPEEIGKCFIRPTPVDQLKSFIEAGL